MIEAFGIFGFVALGVTMSLRSSPPTENCDPNGARAQAIRRAELRGTLALALVGFAIATALILFSLGRNAPALSVLIGGAVATAASHPWPLVRRVLIPLGAWRLAYVWTRIGGPPWVRDPRGGAVLSGVLALCRKRTPQLESLAKLEQELGHAPLRGAGIVATGLIVAERGEVERAATILASVEDLDPDICPPFARIVATNWLVAHAASRGRWHEVVDRATDTLAASSTVRFFGAAANRLLGRETSTTRLIVAWLEAPRRLATAPLFARALRAQPDRLQPLEDLNLQDPPANGHGLLGTGAVAMHLEAARLSAAGAIDPSSIVRLSKAWDATLWDFDVRRRIRARSSQLGCNETVELGVVELDRLVCRDIGGMLPRRGKPPVDSSRTLGRARGLHRDAQRYRIATLVGEFTPMLESKISPAATALWARWVQLRDAYGLAARGASLEECRETFDGVERQLGALVGWLWNDRRERGLANAISFWLVCEAERVRHAEVVAVHQPFVAAGP